MNSYKKYLEDMEKDQLIEMIGGNDHEPPILTRDEPRYSRPQLIWALHKIRDHYTLKVNEEYAEKIIDTINQHRWDLIYNYDWIRFDIRKPGFYMFLAFSFFSIVGAAWCLYTFTINMIELFTWIFR